MEKQKPKKEFKPVNIFRCDQCKDTEEMEFAQFKEHLLTVHNIAVAGMKGNKQMVMHMDGADWYSSTYKWTLESGLTFHQFCENPRRKDDQMRYQ